MRRAVLWPGFFFAHRPFVLGAVVRTGRLASVCETFCKSDPNTIQIGSVCCPPYQVKEFGTGRRTGAGGLLNPRITTGFVAMRPTRRINLSSAGAVAEEASCAFFYKLSGAFSLP